MRIGTIKYSDFHVGDDALDASNEGGGDGRVDQQPCPLQQRAKLTSLTVSASAKTSTSYRDAGHDEVPADIAQHFHFAPNVDDATLTWAVENPGRVRSATLAVYRKGGDGRAMWSGALNAEAVARGSMPWAGPALTAKDSPYLVQLTLTDGPVVDGWETAWTYVDVVLSEEIALVWGDVGEIPAARAENFLTNAQWTLDEERVTFGRLRAPDGQNVAALTADHAVQLESSLFRECNGQAGPSGGAHSNHAQYKAHWGEGPRIPVVARVQVLSAGDAPVFDARAVGDLTLIWDWEDPRAAAANVWRQWIDPATTSALNRKALELEVKKWAFADEPANHNCPANRGGKSGSTSRVLPVMAPGTEFKGTVTALGGRAWSVETRVGNDPAKPGEARVLFNPSRMAGDQYKLSVYLRDGGLDLAKTGPALRLQAAQLKVPRAATGTFEVQRRVTVYAVHPPGVDADWNLIRDSIYKPGGLKLEVVDKPFTAQQYSDALDDAIDDLVANSNDGQTPMLASFVFDRARCDCTAPVVDHAEFLRRVRDAHERRMVVRVRVPAAGWSGTLRRVSDGAQFYIAKAETVSGKEWVHLLPLGEHVLRKGDRVRGGFNNIHDLTLRDEPEALSTPQRAELYRHVAGVTDLGAYTNKVGQLGWVKVLSTSIMESLAATLAPGVNVGGFVFLFARASLMAAPGGSCIWKLSHQYKSFSWCALPPAAADEPLLKANDVVAAHEFGHMLHLQHAHNTLRQHVGTAHPTGIEVEQHVPHASCLMSYDADADRLCGLCVLHMRGWDTNAAYAAVSQDDHFATDDLYDLLLEDVTADGANPWHKIRLLTARFEARQHRDERDTHKAVAKTYLRAIANGAQGGALRITLLRNVLLLWHDWLDTCGAIANHTVHSLFREMVGLVRSPLDRFDGDVATARSNRDDQFCGHKVRAELAATTQPVVGARARLTMRARPDTRVNWPDEPFDGLSEVTTDRASLRFVDTVNAAETPTRSIDGATVRAGLAVDLEDSDPGAANYTTTHRHRISGGSIAFSVQEAQATLNWPSVPAPRKLKVTPEIRYVGDAVLVGADAARTPRRPLVLKADKTFEGDGFFECPHPNLEFWDAPQNGNRVAFDGAGNVFTGAALFAGKQLYVSATSPSHAVDDVVLRLTLRPGKTPLDTSPATRKLTAVEARLSARRTPAPPTTPGTRISDGDKVDPGRFVHKQDQGRHARIAVVIERATPLTYKGKLCLQEVSNVARLGIFKSDRPTRNERALDYFTITNDDVPPSGYELWIEGATTSAALADAVLDLGIKDGKGDGRDYFPGGDQVKVTVVEVTSVQVSLPATPALHHLQYRHANRGNLSPQVDNQTARATLNRAASDAVDVTAGAGPVVLVEGSCDAPADNRAAAVSAQPTLTAAVLPAAAQAKVKWAAIRHAGDANAVKLLSGLPTLAVPDPAHPEVVRLTTDAVGCFHLAAYVDVDDVAPSAAHFTARRQPPSFLVNVVMVRARVHGNPTAVTNAAAYMKLSGTLNAGADFGAHFTGVKAANLRAQVDLVGGGADGKLGLDKVVCGWVQNTTAASYPATYHCNGQDVVVHQRFVVNPGVAAKRYHGEDRIAYPGDVFVALQTPFLDTFVATSAPRAGAPRPAMGDSTQADAVGAAVGQRRTLTMSDGPSRTVEGKHPSSLYDAQGAVLTRITWDLQFRAHVTVATEHASELYTVLGHIDWRARLDWSVTVDPQNHLLNVIANEHTPITVTAQAATVHAQPVMGVDANAEFAWPSMIYAQLWDATDDPLGLGAPP